MSGPPALPLGWDLVALDSTGSTNDVASALAREGAAEGTVVRAFEQVSGRGRRMRAWSGPRGNLMCSILLRPDASPADAAQLSFVAALAVADAVAPLLPASAQPQLKWPNDVLVRGRKISGILLEAGARPDGRTAFVVVGIGINLRHHPVDQERPATSILAETGSAPDPDMVLGPLCTALEGWRSVWNSKGFAPVRQEWLARAHGLGGPIRVRLDREDLDGVFRGVDPAGELVLELPGGLQRRIAAGDVFPARARD